MTSPTLSYRKLLQQKDLELQQLTEQSLAQLESQVRKQSILSDKRIVSPCRTASNQQREHFLSTLVYSHILSFLQSDSAGQLGSVHAQAATCPNVCSLTPRQLS